MWELKRGWIFTKFGSFFFLLGYICYGRDSSRQLQIGSFVHWLDVFFFCFVIAVSWMWGASWRLQVHILGLNGCAGTSWGLCLRDKAPSSIPVPVLSLYSILMTLEMGDGSFQHRCRPDSTEHFSEWPWSFITLLPSVKTKQALWVPREPGSFTWCQKRPLATPLPHTVLYICSEALCRYLSQEDEIA
jgi:hypothetical protein